jgi:hypothetical protein
VNNIMPEPARHGWAELLTLVGAVRRLAFDRSLPPSEALGRIRDAFRSYDEGASHKGPRMATTRCKWPAPTEGHGPLREGQVTPSL